MIKMWLIWLIPVAVIAGLIWAALEAGSLPQPLVTIVVIIVVVIWYVGYSLYLVLMWLLPPAVVALAVLGGMWFIRKLVLDAVREASKQ